MQLAAQQGKQTGFAATGGAHQPHAHARVYLHIGVFDQLARAARQREILELDHLRTARLKKGRNDSGCEGGARGNNAVFRSRHVGCR